MTVFYATLLYHHAGSPSQSQKCLDLAEHTTVSLAVSASSQHSVTDGKTLIHPLRRVFPVIEHFTRRFTFFNTVLIISEKKAKDISSFQHSIGLLRLFILLQGDKLLSESPIPMV